MVVFLIDADGIAIVPTECDPPIGSDLDCVLSLPISLQRVKIESWQVHVLRFRRSIQRVEYGDNALCRLRIDSLGAAPNP